MEIVTRIKLRQWVMASLSVLTCWLIGVILVCLQGIHSLNSDIENQLEGAVIAVDNAVENSEIYMDTLFPIAESCADTKPIMVDQSVYYPGIQTISLLKDNKVYCSSYEPLVGKSILAGNIPEMQLVLVGAKNSPVPGKHIAIFAKSKGDITVAMTLNGYTLFNFLEARGKFTINSLGKWMNSKGEVLIESPTPSVTKYSDKLDLSVNNTLSQDDYYNEIINRYAWVMVLVFLVSLFIGLHVYRMVAKSSSILLMKESLRNNEFVPFAQPIMNDKGQLHGVEILTRWKHQKLGVIDPNDILSQSKNVSLMVQVTTSLIQNTVATLEKVSDQLPEGFHLALNVSEKNFSKDYQKFLFDSCQQFVESPLSQRSNLVLELTERDIIDDYDAVSNVFETLSWMGVKMTIDNFGTGHASLSEINNLKFDFIKIDESFISLIGSDAVSEPLVENMIDLAKRLEIDLIAEGVQRKDQSDYLLRRKVKYVQGNYYAQPMELTAFIDQYFLRK